MADQLALSFADGQPVTAAQMNSLISAYNKAAAELNAISSATANITKSQELVRAYKATAQSLSGVNNGQENIISGWTAELNRGSMLNPATGLITIPETGTYKIEARSFVSINNATRVRAKFSIVTAGAELSKSEANSYGNASTISNYRQDFYSFAQTTFTQGEIASINMRVWDAVSGNIPTENNFDSFIVVSRIY
jgi:hypothetical protein